MIDHNELQLRSQKIWAELELTGATAVLLRSNANHLYLTGSVFAGFTYIALGELPLFFPEKSSSVFADYPRVHAIRKPEEIPTILQSTYDRQLDDKCAVELATLPYSEYTRLAKLSVSGSFAAMDASSLMRTVRSIKTPAEIAEITAAAEIHCGIYLDAPSLYQPGMTDQQWQHAIEYEMRKRGSIGTFRCFGPRMEIFMGNVSMGANADVSSPYDFTMGGAGMPAMPMGASGVEIPPHAPVMVDMAGNFGAYNTDISRVYARGEIAPEALKAHRLSIAMHDYFRATARPGGQLADIYNHCVEMAAEAGLSAHFMGESHQVKFVGHGVGIEINEPPVMTPRWQGSIAEGMILAFEPKFVFRDYGAVGVENTYLVTNIGIVNLTPIPEDIISL